MLRSIAQTSIFIVGLFFFATISVVAAESDESESHVYTTWEGSEPDKGASAWLIKRFIDRDAIFILKPSGEKLTEGIAFDVPEAKFRRTHNLAGYETLLLAYKVEDPIAKKIGQIIHDIEINAWRAKVYPETIIIEEVVREIQENFGEKTVSFDCYLDFFDMVYERLQDTQLNLEGMGVPDSCKISER